MRKTSIVSLVVLILANALCVPTLLYTISKKQALSSHSVPQVVNDFFTQYTSTLYDGTDDEELLQHYFSNGSEIDSTEFIDVIQAYSQDVSTCTITSVSSDFCIVYLFDSLGSQVNPPIGFWYKLDSTGNKIKEWTLGRLQPFSRYDSEYSKEWSNEK